MYVHLPEQIYSLPHPHLANSSTKIFKDNVIYEFKNNSFKQPITITQVNKQLLKEINFFSFTFNNLRRASCIKRNPAYVPTSTNICSKYKQMNS